MTRIQKFLLVCVIVLCVFFRFYKLVHINFSPVPGSLPHVSITADMPGGLFPDEAANGLDILSMEQGDLQPFYERGNGREALFFYMIWGVVKAFGIGVWQHHATSALVGIFATITTFFLTKELYRAFEKTTKNNYSTNLALLATFFMAVSSWYVVLSRTAFRANLIPLFASLTVLFLIKSFSSSGKYGRYLYPALTGISFALGFYTYIAFRILAPILAVAIFYPLVAKIWKDKNLSVVKTYFVPVVISLIAFAVTISPIAHYFITHEGSFIGRSGQVSVFNPELNGGNLIGAIIEVTRLSFVAYFTEGDLNWRHNISGLPFLTPLVSPFFLLGLILVVVRAFIYLFSPNKKGHYWPNFLLTGWFVGMLLPVITTAEGIPHGLRSIGTIPPVFIISAFGLVTVWAWLKKLVMWQWAFSKKTGWTLAEFKGVPLSVWILKNAGVVLGISYIIALPLQTYAQYFSYSYNSPENFYAFRSDLTVVSEYLKNFGNKDNTFLVLDKFSVQTPDYLTFVDPKNPNNPKNRPYIQVDPENIYKLAQLHKIKSGDRVVFTQSSIFDIKKFKQNYPNTKLILEQRNKFGQAVLAVYEIK